MARTRRAILWSPEAEHDLFEIWNYWARETSQSNADNLLREIDRVCTRLRDWPYSGRKRDELVAGLRSAAAHPNVIFYRLRDERVEIVRVLDGRRDIDAIFSEPAG